MIMTWCSKETAGLGLQRLGSTDLAAIRRRCGIERHVLRLERRNMHTAAAELQFEVAARLRDEISELKKELRQMMEATK